MTDLKTGQKNNTGITKILLGKNEKMRGSYLKNQYFK